MTRKHFIALAEALNGSMPQRHFNSNTDGFEHGKYWQWEQDVLVICDVLAELNDRFDRVKFVQKVYGEYAPKG